MAGIPWYQEGPGDKYWPPGQEPSRAKPIGEASSEPVGVYLGSQAMDVIALNLKEEPERPVAGLLVGFPLAGPRRPIILVTDLIPFAIPEEDDGEIRFTPQIFDDILPLWQERRDGASIVGWCHASPGRGVALSNFHRFNHHRHFPRPWQIAMVIDTRRDASLVYRWQDGELVPCEGFYYWDMRSEPPATLFEPPLLALKGSSRERAARDPEQDGRPARRRLLWLLLAAGLLYSLIPQAPGSIAWLSRRIAANAERLSELRQNLDSVQREQERLLQASRPAASPTSVTPALEPLAPTGASTGDAMWTPAAPAARQDAVPVRPATETTAAATPGSVSTVGTAQATGTGEPEYVIQPGDTMWSISRLLLGDPRHFRELAEKNQIDDPDVIFPGQRLIIPRE